MFVMCLQDPGIELSASEQYDVISENLLWYQGKNAQARIFHCLNLSHPEAEGAVLYTDVYVIVYLCILMHTLS